jgi:hypothetical protein
MPLPLLAPLLGFARVIPKSLWKYLAIAIGIAAILAGAYFKGYDKAEDKYLAEIAAFDAQKIILEAKLEAALSKVKVEVVTEYVDRVKVVKEKEYVYRDKIVTVPSKCELSDGWVRLHDTSARGDDAGTTDFTDETPSGIRDTQALGTVIENYSICHQNAEQLKALQNWVRQAQAEVLRLNTEAQEN